MLSFIDKHTMQHCKVVSLLNKDYQLHVKGPTTLCSMLVEANVIHYIQSIPKTVNYNE